MLPSSLFDELENIAKQYFASSPHLLAKFNEEVWYARTVGFFRNQILLNTAFRAYGFQQSAFQIPGMAASREKMIVAGLRDWADSASVVNASYQPKDVPQRMTRRALVEAYKGDWPTIDADLRKANENGLAAAAKATSGRGWLVREAMTWARSKGKLKEKKSRVPVSPFNPGSW